MAYVEYFVEILIAILAFAGTMAGSIIGGSKAQAVMQEQLVGVKEDILTLSSRVDKHNNLIERMAVAESRLAALEREIEN